VTLLERHVHRVDNTAAFWEHERKFREVEDRLGGFPAKRYYYLISSAEDIGTMVQEREWENMATMEAAYDRLFEEPGVVALADSGAATGNTERTEFCFTAKAL